MAVRYRCAKEPLNGALGGGWFLDRAHTKGVLYTELQERNLVPERGIEPPSTDYETVVLPLYYAGMMKRLTEKWAPQPEKKHIPERV